MPMPLSTTRFTQKQILLGIVALVVIVVILIVIGNMYGRFLTTQVAPPPAVPEYAIEGIIKSSVIQDPGTYTLQFHAQNADGTGTDASTTFQVNSNSAAPQ